MLQKKKNALKAFPVPRSEMRFKPDLGSLERVDVY